MRNLYKQYAGKDLLSTTCVSYECETSGKLKCGFIYVFIFFLDRITQYNLYTSANVIRINGRNEKFK